MLRLWTLRPPWTSLIRPLHLTATACASQVPVPAPISSSVQRHPSENPKVTFPENPKWTPDSVRTGLIARKRGMSSMWNDQGVQIPVTILQLESCQVTANIVHVRKDHSTYRAVQLAATDKPWKTTTKQMRGHFRKAAVVPKRIVKEFPVTADAHVPVGTTMSAIHFVPGQGVDVISTSIGKGFQGGMKLWNFKGLRASHGVSKAHRSSGSAGNSQDPGRIWPGKKMAGRMGGERVTTENLKVVRVDTQLELIFIKGHVPGVDNAQVMIRDAKKRMVMMGQHNQAKGLYEKVLPKGVDDLPFPAGTVDMAKKLPPIIAAPSYRRNPNVPQD